MNEPMTPSPDLERRTVASLRDAGLIVRRSPWLPAAFVASIVAAFLGGLFAGPLVRTDPQQEFLLLLHSDARQSAPAESVQRVDEYRQWARSVRERGVRISGEKLDPARSIIGTSPPAPGASLGGFFRIEAATLEEAQTIANTCPHIRHGGWIEVRKIEKT